MKASCARRYPFTVEVNGRTYNCWREVTGTRKLRQTVYVEGVGNKPDAEYGKGAHPICTMEGVAKVVAREIIRENQGVSL